MFTPNNCIVYRRKEDAAEPRGYFAPPPCESLLQGGNGYIVYDNRFLSIVGSNPSLSIIAEDASEAFAHEAGVYIPTTGDVFITSNHIKRDGKKKVQISKVWTNSASNSSNHGTTNRDYHVELVYPQPDILLANGGVNYKDGILFCEQGSLTKPGGLTYMCLSTYETTTILTNYHGRWFNSVNDVVIHNDGSIWFTDPPYGYEQGIRPVPQLPAQTYRFDPSTGDIRAVEDSLRKPNGLCFSPNQKTMYITDTAAVRGDTRCPGVYSPAEHASIYAFDVVARDGGSFLTGKRLFAFADQGIPDGIKCDRQGNVYSGCGDGVNVWTPGGMLIGKICVPGGCANFCFGSRGEVFLLNERKMWRAQLSEGVRGDLLGI